MHILLIDDSTAYREEFEELLAHGGFATSVLQHARNATLGWHMINTGKYEIIFVDYRMPGESGLDLIKRARGSGIDQPFICLTGFEDPRLDQEAEQVGANGYLQKGEFSSQLLTRTIRYAVRNAALVTELATARDAAHHASAAKSRFLAGMSHELRTPLHGILGYAQLLRQEGGLAATQTAAWVDAMMEASKHLLQIINQVLDLSEVEAERVRLQPVNFDVQAVVQACIDLIRPTAEAKGLVLSMVMAQGTPQQLAADPTRLRQILLNLLGNATKFTSQGGIEVRLQPSANGRLLRIAVIDTGAGIPADQRQRLFQEFGRLDTTATQGAEGAGLGLDLSARLARLMGGRLDHEDNPSGGSVFWLELPLITISCTMMHSTKCLTSDMVDFRSSKDILHILVVDDNAMNRDIACAFLEAVGYKVTCVNDGEEAVAAVKSINFDAVLMDVCMSGIDGLEATRRIRALSGTRGQVPIIGLTALAFTDQIEECRKAGMSSHLGKPFSVETLIASILLAIRAGPRPQASPHYEFADKTQ